MLIVCFYVDLILIGDFGINVLRPVMESEFEMNDLGLMKFFLSIEVQQSKSGIFILQSKYASEVLRRFNMSYCNTAPTPVVTGFKIEQG